MSDKIVSEQQKDHGASLLPADASAQAKTEALPRTVYANGNANGAYIRIRSVFHGAWVAIGDDDREREVWFSTDEVRQIAAALLEVIRGNPPQGSDK